MKNSENRTSAAFEDLKLFIENLTVCESNNGIGNNGITEEQIEQIPEAKGVFSPAIVSDRTVETSEAKEKQAARPIREGNTVTFGVWPQSIKADGIEIKGAADNNGRYTGSDGERYVKFGDDYFKVEPIKWRILSESGGTAVILSETILEAMNFDENVNNYAESEVRAWLNGEFYDKAFSDGAKTYIQTTVVDNSAKSAGYSSNLYACGNTSDRVFLLSYEEAFEKYGLTDYDRGKRPSAYAERTGAWVENGNGWWWLRSPCSDSSFHAQFVFDDGTAFWNYVCNVSVGVVPALQIQL